MLAITCRTISSEEVNSAIDLQSQCDQHTPLTCNRIDNSIQEKHTMQPRKVMDGGGFPIFTSYHDYRLPVRLVGPLHTDHIQFKAAFQDFANTISADSQWRRHFSPSQSQAIERALPTNGPRIGGFVWHHHQDHGVLQLVTESEHRHIAHYGARFTTGGRC